MVMVIEKTIKIDVEEIKTMIEHKHNVEIIVIKCSHRGIKCWVK